MFKCNHIGCDTTFDHAEQRRRHQNKCGKPPKPKKVLTVGNRFACSKCLKEYSHKCNVHRHAKDCGHTTKWSISSKSEKTCKICGVVWQTPSKLKRHMSVHYSKPILSCVKCRVAYTRSDHHQKHISACR